jgi:hypothetical protein
VLEGRERSSKQMEHVSDRGEVSREREWTKLRENVCVSIRLKGF